MKQDPWWDINKTWKANYYQPERLKRWRNCSENDRRRRTQFHEWNDGCDGDRMKMEGDCGCSHEWWLDLCRRCFAVDFLDFVSLSLLYFLYLDLMLLLVLLILNLSYCFVSLLLEIWIIVDGMLCRFYEDGVLNSVFKVDNMVFMS